MNNSAKFILYVLLRGGGIGPARLFPGDAEIDSLAGDIAILFLQMPDNSRFFLIFQDNSRLALIIRDNSRLLFLKSFKSAATAAQF